MNKVVDNFDLLGDLLPLHSSNEDKFWVIHIIKRNKENPDLEKNSKHLKVYHVKDREELLLMKDKITTYAKDNNARAYFDPNPKSWKKVALQTMKELANIIEQEDYKRSFTVVEKAMSYGSNYGKDTKVWIVDIDDFEESEIEYTIRLIRQIVSSYDARYTIKDPIIARVPTIHGEHLLTVPFNLQMFINEFSLNKPYPEIKKSNPTLLYYGIHK